MKTLPKYYVIARDSDDTRWIQCVDWVNAHQPGSEWCYDWNYIWYDGSARYNWYDRWDDIRWLKNNPTIITLDDWEEATQEKPKPKRYTYTTTYTREDWVSFTSDSIDGKKIADLEAEEKEYYKQARAIRALLNAHRNLKF